MRLAARALVLMAAAILMMPEGRMDAQTALPSAPLNLVATVVNDVLSVTWDAPATGAPILNYLLQVGGAGLGSGFAIPTTTPNFSAPIPSGLAPILTFSVSAVNVVGQGPASATVGVGTGSQTVPSAPLNLVASVVNDILNVSWDAPLSGAPIVNYVLSVTGPGLGGGVSTPSAATSFTTPFPSGVIGTFTFAVSAVNLAGPGPSATVSVSLGPRAVPSAPRRLAVSHANEMLSVTWDEPLSGAPLTSYVLRVSGPGVQVAAGLPATGTSFSTPFPSSMVGTFAFTLSAVNQLGEGAPSSVATLLVGPGTLPGAPQNLAGGVAGNMLSLTWDAPTAGTPIVSYVLRVAGPGIGAVAVAWPSVSFSTPFPSSAVGTFTFTVSAVNQLGEGPPSAVLTLVLGPTAVPEPPRNLTAQLSGTALVVAWEPPGNGAESYVLRATGSAFQGVWTLPTTSTIFTAPFAQMAPGNYAFTVSGVNVLGEGAPTAPATVTIGPPCPVPSAPTLSASRNGNVVSFSWTTPTVGVVSSYTALVSTPGGGVNQVAADVGLVTAISGPVASGTYFVQVRAQSACGPGAPSNQVRVDVP